MSVEDVLHPGPGRGPSSSSSSSTSASVPALEADEDLLSPAELRQLVKEHFEEQRAEEAALAGGSVRRGGSYPRGCRNRWRWHWLNGVRCPCSPKPVQLNVIAQGLMLLALVLGISLGALVPVAMRPVPAVREYFVAAEEVEWDYAPRDKEVCADQHWRDEYLIARHGWVGNVDGSNMTAARIGSKYGKVRYVEYTDATFNVRKAVAPEWRHLGLLGPALRGEVGDVVRVHFRNKARIPASLHPFAVHAAKHSEGAAYADGARDSWSRDDRLAPAGLRQFTCGEAMAERGAAAVPGGPVGCRSPHTVKPGDTLMQDWPIEEAMGPGPDDPSTVVHLYASAADGSTHAGISAGLVGPLIIGRKGASSAGSTSTTSASTGGRNHLGRPQGVDREFVVLYTVGDENASPLLDANIHKYVTVPSRGPPAAAAGKPGFVAFGALDKALVLQALYAHATHGLSKLSYADAKAEVDESVAASRMVGLVPGTTAGAAAQAVEINVWFNDAGNYFDPAKYDAAHGGVGTAAAVVEDLERLLVDKEDPKFRESNMMHGINGFVYCNSPDLVMGQGEAVRWYVVAVGTEQDVHTPHWHGNTLLLDGRRVDELEMLPGTTAALDMVPENPGNWMFHCHVNDHIDAGMVAMYSVEPRADGGGVQPAQPGQSAADADAAAAAAILSAVPGGRQREYFVAAEKVDWDYNPGGRDMCDDGGGAAGGAGQALPAAAQTTLAGNGVDRIGSKYGKVRYVEYTDATFTVRKAVAPEWRHLGLLGPALRAEVGDELVVHFRNKHDARSYSLHPHGVFYTKRHEGFAYADGSNEATDRGDDAVAPGATYTYRWPVPASAAPGPKEGSSKVWLYHSHVSEVDDTNAGLVGPILVTAKGAAADPGAEDAALGLRPRDVAHEFVLLFHAPDESRSTETAANMRRFLPDLLARSGNSAATASGGNAATNATAAAAAAQKEEALERLFLQLRLSDPGFAKSQLMSSINGRTFCTLDGLDGMRAGDGVVRWHLVSLGSGVDIHAPSWTGHAVSFLGHRVTAMQQMPATMRSADMVLGSHAQVGSFRLFDHVFRHLAQGAMVSYAVGSAMTGALAPVSASAPPFTGEERAYFVAADEVEWDYAPHGRDLCAAAAVEEEGGKGEGAAASAPLFDEHARVFMDGASAAEPHRIGRRYVKGLFREYTGADFSTLRWGKQSRANAASKHLGILGPVFRAKVGDKLRVTLRNNLAFPVSLALDGALYPTRVPVDAADAAGTAGAAGVAGGVGSAPALQPGQEGTYEWVVGTEAGPGAEDGSTTSFLYYSDAGGRAAGINTALVGNVVVGKAGDATTAAGAPHVSDAHREFVALFATFDENLSLYRDLNVLRYARRPESVAPSDPGFKESNKMHTINGFMYCNGPPFALKQGQRARWYVHAVGSDHDMHTPRWYGNSVRLYGRSVAVPELLPGESKAVDMLADNRGKWLVHCEVHDHAVAGMRAFLDVGSRIHYDKTTQAPGFVQWTPTNACVPCAAGATSTRWVKCCEQGADGDDSSKAAKDVQAWGNGAIAAAILVPAVLFGCGLFAIMRIILRRERYLKGANDVANTQYQRVPQ